MGSVPSEATISRFLKVLSETDLLGQLHCALVEQAEQLGIIDTDSVAIDSSKVEAYEKSKPRKYLPLDGINADWAVKKNTDGKTIAWFGYKLHIATDTKSELPIAL